MQLTGTDAPVVGLVCGESDADAMRKQHPTLRVVVSQYVPKGRVWFLTQDEMDRLQDGIDEEEI